MLRRPWHAIGMMAGILLGVASATAAVVIADTQEAQIALRFDAQRSSYAVVRAESAPPSGFPTGEVERVAGLDPVFGIGEFSLWSDHEPVTRAIASRSASVPVIVADPGGMAASGTKVIAGASPDLLASAPGLPVAWVGADLADQLGVAPANAGPGADADVVVAGHPLSVAGIVANTAGFGYAENSIILSRQVAVDMLGGSGTNVRLVAHVRPGSARAVAGYAIRTVDPGGLMVLVDQTPPDGEHLVGTVGRDLRRVGTALGLIVGLVGMVAVSNTLMMAVHHRLRELGLRSAIGWSRPRIALLVLSESGVAGATAALLGTAAGLGVASVWCWSQDWTLVVAPLLPALATVAGLLASLLGGVVPALRAASLSPLAAMRS